MFTRNVEVQTPGQLGPKPSLTDSFIDAVQKPFYDVAGFASVAVPQLSTPEFRKRIKDKIDVINQSLNDPRLGLGQKAANFIGELGSSIVALAPLATVGAEVGGSIAAGVATGVIPEAGLAVLRQPITKLFASKYAKYLPNMSTTELTKTTAKVFGGYKGLTIPEHVLNNYNKETDQLNWKDTIKEWSKDNFGFLIPAVPFVAGGMIYKILNVRKADKASKVLADKLLKEHESIKAREELEGKKEGLQSELSKMVTTAFDEGRISTEEHAWFTDYLVNPKDESLFEKGIKLIANKNSIDNANASIWFPVIDNKNLKLYQNALLSEVTSGISLDESQALSGYVMNNFLDQTIEMLRDNPQLKDNVEGMLGLLNRKLEQQSKVLEKTDSLLKEHVYKVDKDLFENPNNSYLFKNRNKEDVARLKRYHELKENPQQFKDAVLEKARLLKEHPEIENEYEMLTGNILSQENIYKHFSQNKLNAKKAPYLIPERVKERLSIDRRMKKASLEENIKLGKMKELYNFESIPEEVQRLTNDIISNLNNNYKKLPQYRRLQELSDLRQEAKYALDRIALEEEYNKQRSFAKIIQNYIDTANSNAKKFADPNKVVEYLSKQLSDESPLLEDYAKVNSALEERQTQSVKAKEGQDQIGVKELSDEEIEAIQAKDAEDAKKEFNTENKRYEQFAKNQDILKESILCVMEKLNG